MNVNINSKSLGITGVVLLVIGCFLPFAGVPFFGSVSYLGGGLGDGLIVIGLAGLGAFFIVRENYKALWLPAVASGALVTSSTLSVLTGIGSYSNYFSIQIGALVIYAGAALLGWAAKSAPASDKPKPERISMFSQGNKTSSVLILLGLLLTMSAPLVLMVQITVDFAYLPSFLFYWLFAGLPYSFSFLAAPIIAFFFLTRGYPLWSLIGPVYALIPFSGAEAAFWEGPSSKETYYALSPIMEFTYLLPIAGAVLFGIGAILVAKSRRKSSNEKI
jgi:hypothetical protein